MAYTHGKFEYLFTASKNQNLTSTGDKDYWVPMYKPVIIRACGVIITTATVGTAGVVDFDYRPTAGSDTGRVSSGGIARINIPAKAAGTVIYKDGLNQTVSPGAEVVVKVTTAIGTSGAAHQVFYAEPTWEEPGNNTAMLATT